MDVLGSRAVLMTADYLVGVLLVRGLLLTALLVGVGLLVLRGASAARRTTLWATGAAGLLLLPVVVELAPGWELGLLSFPDALFRGAGAAAGTGAAAPGAGAASPGASPPATSPVTPAAWLALAWAAGALLVAGRFGLHWLRIGLVSRRARPVADGSRLATLAREVTARAGVPSVRVALSDVPGVPLTRGLLRPVILLPSAAEEWLEALQRSVLEHEVAHVVRRDYLTLLLMEACRAIHWPNPLVWLLIRRAREDQERACDDAAIRSGIEPARYARHLVAVARSFALGPARPVASLPIVRASSLRRRVEAVMTRDVDRTPMSPRTLALCLGLVVAPGLGLATANPWVCPAADGAAAEEPASQLVSLSPQPDPFSG